LKRGSDGPAPRAFLTARTATGTIFGFGYGGYGLYLDASGYPALGRIGIDETMPAVNITDTGFHHLAVTQIREYSDFLH